MSPDLGLRLALAAAVMSILVLWEVARPKRPLAAPRLGRWTTNLGLCALSGLMLVALSASSLALVAAAKSFELKRVGLLHLTSWPYPFKFGLGFLLLDLGVYAQHWAFHAVPWLWRVHKVHHTDLDVDATTGVRFHPLEILLSLVLKLAIVAFFGLHFLVVGVFEIALNLGSLFDHADIRLPERFDHWLRLFLVTPDMHRIHHSTRRSELNSNFGFLLPWWDHLLGTYEEEPESGPILMSLGLPDHRDPKKQGLLWLLLLPFK